VAALSGAGAEPRLANTTAAAMTATTMTTPTTHQPALDWPSGLITVVVAVTGS
jgi:hypothetical protein